MTFQNRTIRISEPNELIDSIPYLLGFHPRNSLCLLGFAGNPDAATRQVELAARIDIPAKQDAPASLGQLVDAVARSGSHSALALIYPDDSPDRMAVRHRWNWLHNVVGIVAGARDIALLDVLVVSADHWWSLCCNDATCCPEEGHLRVAGESAAAAEAVYAGLVAANDRSDLEACLAGADAAERAELEPLIAEAENRMVQAITNNQLRRMVRRDVEAVMRAAGRPTGAPAPTQRTRGTAAPVAGRLTPRQLARHAVALGQRSVRDVLWLAIDERSVDASGYLLQLIHQVPRPYDATALFLFGWHQWRTGNGTLACIAAERALESDPACSAAELLVAAVQHGLNPTTTPPLRGPLVT